MINKNKFEIISKRLLPQLKYKDLPNKQLIITFAGVSYSGKTAIAKILEDKYKSVSISSDNLMGIASREYSIKNLDYEKLKNDYIYYILKNPPFRNHLIILDKSMDREYKRFFEVCKSNDLNYFLIQLEISRKNAVSRAKKRNPHDLDSWLSRFDRWFREHEEFKKNVKSDVILDGAKPDLKRLFKKIDSILESTN